VRQLQAAARHIETSHERTIGPTARCGTSLGFCSTQTTPPCRQRAHGEARKAERRVIATLSGAPTHQQPSKYRWKDVVALIFAILKLGFLLWPVRRHLHLLPHAVSAHVHPDRRILHRRTR
jgi:hypothetical protein